MKVPVSWLKDFVEINQPIEEIARALTASGLEVEEIRYVGWKIPQENRYGFKMSGIDWDPEKIVVAEITQVNQHPNADRLTLCELFDGIDHHTVLTGAPNLHPFVGKGKLQPSIKVAYAKEGAVIYDGHSEELVLTKLKRAKIRGVESYSMVCSEKELGISNEHEGVIFLDQDAPVGASLESYLGDAVLDISILPNNARNVNIYGIAREVSALFGLSLKKIVNQINYGSAKVRENTRIEITDSNLNPRFILGLIENVSIKKSPYWVERRLRLAGMRPINNVVDATNYAMLEVGAPLHAFDYDVLKQRAGSKPVKIITRAARAGEKLTTLDNMERTLTADNVLVCDETSALSIAGVMGGLESEIYFETDGVQVGSRKTTQNILLEGASWNFINIRRTANQHNLHSEAAFRFSRGVHPEVTLQGIQRCLYWMQEWSGGTVAADLLDVYPLPVIDPVVSITASDVRRTLGIDLSLEQIADLLSRLEFECEIKNDQLLAKTPSYRLDIGEGIIGKADLMEEISRLYGLDNIPETRMADPLPTNRTDSGILREDLIKDLLVELGLQEVITHRMSAPEIENKLFLDGGRTDSDYLRLSNPITPEKRVMRRSLLSSVMGVVERNQKIADSIAVFEVGPVFLPSGNSLPKEPRQLAIVMNGSRQESSWLLKDPGTFDFYDLKGVLEALFAKAHLTVTFVPTKSDPYHPGKCAAIMLGETVLGTMGELHPLIAERFDCSKPVIAVELDLETVIDQLSESFDLIPVSDFPPVFEDIAITIDENIPAKQVETLIRQTGGKVLASVQLFDIFRSENIGIGKKSLAYSLKYQSFDGTLSDVETTKLRNKIIKRLEHELGAKLRG